MNPEDFEDFDLYLESLKDGDSQATIRLFKKEIKLSRWYQLRRKYRNWKFKRYLKKNPKVAMNVAELVDEIDKFLAFGDEGGEV